MKGHELTYKQHKLLEKWNEDEIFHTLSLTKPERHLLYYMLSDGGRTHYHTYDRHVLNIMRGKWIEHKKLIFNN